MNNEPGKVIAKKGLRNIHHATSGEMGQTITVVACCSAEDNFLPPYCIFKARLHRGNRNMSGGMRSGENGGCSICTLSPFCQELFHGIVCVRASIVMSKEPSTLLCVLRSYPA
ncbi:hypothetical protein TNCV_2691361 [Trichonephila clavipes]|uniref:Uncharacterized protein n=1 Tax=Trichonephila clavipes TaxID=2585209 RepID=A0A8X7BAB7_TRICX|nr:hypothetical protein TNCV_2691361 [Trichonephila clavipes]